MRGRDDDFEHWLVASLVVGVEEHALFLSFYRRVFDASMFAAHGMFVVQYVFVLVGLFISMHSIFKREAEAYVTKPLKPADLFQTIENLSKSPTEPSIV